MAKSLVARFDGRGKEVVEYARKFGRFRAMERYGVRDVVAFDRFLERMTGESAVGLRYGSPAGSGSLGEEIIEAFLLKVKALESENKRLRDKAEVLEERLRAFSDDSLREKGEMLLLSLRGCVEEKEACWDGK
jgi:hypothetical protein